MSSDLFVLENSIFSDSFLPFIDSSIDHDIFQSISNTFDNNNSTHQNQLEETKFIHQFPPTLLSSSPPSYQLRNLSLSQTTHLENGYADFSDLEVKTEECQVNMDSLYGNSFVTRSYGGSSAENLANLMQRSYSLLESPNFETKVFRSPETSFTAGQMRRVCSTGDLQMKTGQTKEMSLARERPFMEEANFKVRRYSVEEKKERILRYRAKRNQRNFNKTIKYACRKTLADSRSRIRGRFARNDEAGEIPKTTSFSRYEDLWNDGFNEEDEEGTVNSRQFFNNFVPPQFQYYGY